MFIEGAFFSQGNISLMASEASLVVQREMLWNALSDGKKRLRLMPGRKHPNCLVSAATSNPSWVTIVSVKRGSEPFRKRGNEGVRE